MGRDRSSEWLTVLTCQRITGTYDIWAGTGSQNQIWRFCGVPYRDRDVELPRDERLRSHSHYQFFNILYAVSTLLKSIVVSLPWNASHIYASHIDVTIWSMWLLACPSISITKIPCDGFRPLNMMEWHGIKLPMRSTLMIFLRCCCCLPILQHIWIDATHDN